MRASSDERVRAERVADAVVVDRSRDLIGEGVGRRRGPRSRLAEFCRFRGAEATNHGKSFSDALPTCRDLPDPRPRSGRSRQVDGGSSRGAGVDVPGSSPRPAPGREATAPRRRRAVRKGTALSRASGRVTGWRGDRLVVLELPPTRSPRSCVPGRRNPVAIVTEHEERPAAGVWSSDGRMRRVVIRAPRALRPDAHVAYVSARRAGWRRRGTTRARPGTRPSSRRCRRPDPRAHPSGADP